MAPEDRAATELAAVVLLQRKGRLLDAMSANFAALRGRLNPEDRVLLDQLGTTTSRLAKLALNGPGRTLPDAYRAELARMEEQREKLETDISARNAEFRGHSQPVTLASVRAAVPSDAALVEFAVYRPFDPKAELETEAYGAPRYMVYVLRQQELV